MSRIVSIWLPDWAIERLRRRVPASVPAAEPFALVEKGPHGLRISAANAAARAAGVTVGAALPDVRAAIPGLAVQPAETARDRKALLALAGWLGRYGPTGNVDGADAAWVDVTGVPHLFGGEARLCADLAGRLGRLGVTVRIGLADTLGAAHALARFAPMPAVAPWAIAPPGEVRDPLAGLSVAALRLEPEVVRLLVRLGLKRIGQLYGLPRAALAARFREALPRAGRKTADTAAALLLRLDQALGLASEPRRPLQPPPEALSRLAFPEPLLTSEGVEAALQRLAAALQQQLESQALGSQRFRLALYRTDGTVAAATVGTSAPCRDGSHVCRLMRERLGSLDAGFGIDVATLEAGRLAPLVACQVGFADGGAGEVGATALIDRIASRLGPARIRLWAAGASHVPERAEAWRPAMDAGDGSRGGEAAAGRQSRADEREEATTLPSLSRPPLLLSPPEPISVIAELPEGAPQRFVWRRLARRIVRSDGPERIAPEWWRHVGALGPPPGTRDYYRLEDATGARYWVFREGLYGRAEQDEDGEATASDGAAAPALPRWFVHGLFA